MGANSNIPAAVIAAPGAAGFVTPTGGTIELTPGIYYTPARSPDGTVNLGAGLWSVTSAVPAGELNSGAQLSTEELQQNLAAEDAPIPLVFGRRADCGAYIAAAQNYDNKLVLCCVWCHGEIQAIDQIYMDDAALPGTVTRADYTGTAGQTVNSTLAAAIPGFNDAMPGTAYSVLSIPAGLTSGFPRLVADIRGLKVPLTSGGAATYTDNPAYIIAALIENTTFGLGRSVDWTSVATVAAACDALVGGEKKRLLNIALAESQLLGQWLRILCAYAGCWIVPEGAGFRLVPDTTGASVKSFTMANIAAGSLTIDVRGTRNTPTIIEVAYTNTAEIPWREAVVSLPDSPPSVRRVSRVQMPGITRHSEARRFGIERLNNATLNDMVVKFAAFDEALSLQVGDLFDVTHDIGLTAKVFRAMQIEQRGAGRWSIVGAEYDAAVYSSEVVAAPSVLDTSWANPAAPPSLGSITLAEEVYQTENGLYASRLRVNWTANEWPFLSHYRITVSEGATLIDTATAERAATTYATAAVKDSVQYSVAVAIVSTTLAIGAESSANYTPAGKYLTPGNVPTLTGFEAGGKVFLYWSAAADLDITRYEIRYGVTGGSWSTATVVDRVDALSYVANGIPAGTFRFYVAALDSVGQYSPTPVYKDLTVTLDSSAFLLDTHTFTAPTLTNMTAYTARPDERTHSVVDFGDGLGYGADNTDNAVGTFGDSLVNVPFASPHTAGTATYVTETWDVGQVLSGNFTFNATYTDLVGTASLFVDTKANIGDGWTEWTGGSGKATARYTRGRIQGTGAFVVSGNPTCRVDAFPRTENGSVTCGTAATTVQLSYKYAAAKSVQLTPQGTAARLAVFDNVQLSLSGTNSFDVYLFNSGGSPTAGDVSWRFEGI